MAAAASIRSLLHALPTTHTTTSSSSNNCSLLSFSATSIFESKTPTLKTVTLKPISSFLNSRLSSSSSFASYAETDEDDYEDEEGEQEEEGGGEIGLAKSPPAEETGRLYVGNLPYSVTSDQLAEMFSQAGTVETTEVTEKTRKKLNFFVISA